MKRRSRGMRVATAGMLALALLASAPAVRAQTSGDATTELDSVNWQRVGRYVGCALGVASVGGGFALAGVMLACLTLMLDP